MTTTTPVPVGVPGWGQKSTMLAITLIPFAGVVAAVTLLWNNAVGWSDLGLMAVLYILMGFGITIGFHRMLTHRAFEAIAAAEGDAAGAGLDGDSGPGDRLGGRPPHPPRLL